jgi:hypothetical protein
MGAPDAEGEVLLELANHGAARFLLGYGVVFALAGVVVAALGYPLGLVTLLPLPFFVWLSRRMGRKRIVFTTKGVRCANGRHAALDDFVEWESIHCVVFETKRETGEASHRSSFMLRLDRVEREPVRYLFPSRPSDEELRSIFRLAKERGVAIAGLSAFDLGGDPSRTLLP